MYLNIHYIYRKVAADIHGKDRQTDRQPCCWKDFTWSGFIISEVVSGYISRENPPVDPWTDPWTNLEILNKLT